MRSPLPSSLARRDGVVDRPRGGRHLVSLALVALLMVISLAARVEAAAYVQLTEIAARYSLAVETELISGLTVLTDGENRLALAPGAYCVIVNGRTIQLPGRVSCHRGDLIIPASAVPEIESCLRRPQPAAPPVSVVPAGEAVPRAKVIPGSAGTIVIDPGHGGKHTGARGSTGLLEKDLNLAISFHLRALLEHKGWKVVMTRVSDRHLDDDVNRDLDARVVVANRTRADLFVSVHANYAESSNAAGFEVYHAKGRSQSAALARSIHRSLKATVRDEDRGVKTAGFRVIKGARVPAVLVEVGFVSHPASERRLRSERYRVSLARAIADGIAAYRRESR